MTWRRALRLVLLAALQPCAWSVEEETRAHRIMFVALSQKSHVLHVQGMAEEAAARGHHVEVAALDSDRNIVSDDVHFVSLREPERDAAYYNYTRDIFSLFALMGDYTMHVFEALDAHFQRLDELPDVLAFDSLYWPAGHVLSVRYNISGIMLLPGLAGLHFLGEEPDYVPMVISGMAAPVGGDVLARLKNMVMLRAARWVLKRARDARYAPFFAKHAPDMDRTCPYGYTRLALHGSTLGLAEVSRVQLPLGNPMLQSTGSWLPRAPRADVLSAGPIARLLNAPEPLVLIAIGTNAEFNEALARVIVRALRATSGPSFNTLWVVKPEQRAAFLEPALSAEGALPESVEVLGHTDQHTLLNTGKVAAFVSHCGFGSVQEALYAGVPLVAMPMMLDSDQVSNAARLVSNLGVALSFDARPGHDNITSEGLLTRIRTLLDPDSAQGRTIRANARRLREHSRMFRCSARAVDWLELVVRVGVSHIVPLENSVGVVQLYSLDLYAIIAALVGACAWVCCRVCRGTKRSQQNCTQKPHKPKLL